jgi:hypothetical protein
MPQTNGAEVLMLHELFSCPGGALAFADRDVRVTGTVQYIAAGSRVCQIVHAGCSLLVDLQLVDQQGLREGSLFQFLGTLRRCNDGGVVGANTGIATVLTSLSNYNNGAGAAPQTKNEVYLQAIVKRCVDGLDLALFEQALQLRRKYVQKAAASTSTEPPPTAAANASASASASASATAST